MSQAIQGLLQSGRDAIARHAWREGFDFLCEADRAEGLGPEDLERLAEAAWWTGRLAACIDAHERVYKVYIDSGNTRRAGLFAVELARNFFSKHDTTVGSGWLSRAERLLQQDPNSLEYGYFLRAKGVVRFEGARSLDDALTLTQRALEIGTRHGSRDLMAMALHDQGRILVAKGQVREGMALMDEATIAAVSGELGPRATGIVYCNMIGACEDLADYRRAGEWTEAAKRWCERQAIAGFPGMCRVHRAEIMRLRGAWAEAEQEARRACEELREFNLSYTAEALYQIGEIRLRMGDLNAAEDAFRQAHELGRDPQPGLALLRLAEGKPDAALTAIKSVLADESMDTLSRARSLPACAEIALAAGDGSVTQAAVEEMETIAKTYGSPALEAGALYARGAFALARGEVAESIRSLRRSLRLWQEVDVPYETARARLKLALAHRAAGDEGNAALELESAHSTFDHLGAVPDAQRATELLGGGAPIPRVAPQAETKTFMFTDMVKSTSLIEAIGDQAWQNVLQWHDQTLRTLFARYGGEEIDHTGDGFFIAFGGAPEAVECAVEIQRTLTEHRRTHGFAPQVRIGLHATSAPRRGRGFAGKGVHTAARIMALAGPDEILVSQESLRGAPARFPASEPRMLRLKGLADPVSVVSLHWRP